MSRDPFALTLVRKSERALRSAQFALRDGDHDGAVNRSYGAMFDTARAALLRAGSSEDNLPRTHNDLIEMFRTHAVKSGLVHAGLAAELSRAESLRIKADYTGLETERGSAAEAVGKAELFVRQVQTVFSLGEPSLRAQPKPAPARDDEISEPQPASLEDIRRQARENWLKLRQQQIAGDTARGRGPGNDAAPDRGFSLEGRDVE